MKDNNNKTNTLLLTVIAIATLMVAVIGATFAYFTANTSGSETISTIQMTGGRLTISYADNSASLSYNQTNGSVEPQEAAVIQKAFVLTGTNTTDLTMPYEVNMHVVNNEFSNNALTYVLTNDTVNNGTITLENSGNGSIPGPLVTFEGPEADYTSATKGTAVTNQTIKLAEGNFTKTEGATHQYKLSVFFKDNGKKQDYDKQAKFAAYIDITAKQATEPTEP